MGNESIDIYKTRDLAEAAALLTLKRSLLEITREKNICWFVFDNNQRCQEISRQFFFDTLLVNAREYSEALTRLKSRIFA